MNRTDEETMMSERMPAELERAGNPPGIALALPPELIAPLAGLREYLARAGEPGARLYPNWRAHRLGIDERSMLGALIG